MAGLLWSAVGFALSWVPLIDAVGGILILVGFILLFQGRREFGPGHYRWVVRASALFLGGIAAAIAASGVLAWLQFRATLAGLGSSGATGTIGPGLANELQVVVVILTVLGVLGLLARVLLVLALADRRTTAVLWAGFALGTVIAVASGVAAFSILTPGANAVVSFGSYANSSELFAVAGVVSAIPFAWAYYHLREQRRARSY